MLHEIIITACLATAPQFGNLDSYSCQREKDVYVTIEYDAPTLIPPMCQKIGFTEAAKWESEHPGWIARKVRCAPPKKKSQDI